MNTSGTPSTADERNVRERATKVAPRRHLEPTVPLPGGGYDSSEFPVLLRMPDVSLPPRRNDADERLDWKHDERTAGQVTTTQPSPPSRISRHSRSSSGSDQVPSDQADETRTTGSASVRFWSTIPPQVAAGGMLLAVIGLCVVLLRGSDPPLPATSPGKEWSGGSLPADAHELSETPLQPSRGAPSLAPQDWQPGHSSVAAKPVPPQLPAAVPPTRPSPEPASRWPDTPTRKSESDGDENPVQGWPAELQEESQGVMLNSPISQNRSTVSSVPSLGGESSDPGSTDSPRLTGTIVIPPPAKILRK
jgi:hypothetical protein